MMARGLSLLLRLALLAMAAALTGVWLGREAALAAAGLVLLLWLLWHERQLARLLAWLRRPEAETLPEGRGIWAHVFVGLYRLLREEEKRRTRLKAELDVFSQAAEASPDGLVILDADDRIVWCNRMAELHLGLRGERDAGLLLTNLVRLPRLAEFLARPQGGEALLYRPPDMKGGVLSLEVVRFGRDRKLLISFDVTQIERVAAMRRDFVANVSHELRTPLTVLAGYLEHMAEAAAGGEGETGRQVEILRAQVDRMLRLVGDLLTLSRLEDETQVLREESIDVRDLVYQVSAEARRLSGGRHSITCEVVPALLRGSRDELHSAFSNLVSNAVRYTPEGGRIVLRWQMSDGQGVFSVEDSGIGIPEEHIPRLTERFYRVDRGRSRESGGTGLGLSIVKHVLMRHQATLEIESQPGVGSIFRARFPSWRLTQLQG